MSDWQLALSRGCCGTVCANAQSVTMAVSIARIIRRFYLHHAERSHPLGAGGAAIEERAERTGVDRRRVRCQSKKSYPTRVIAIRRAGVRSLSCRVDLRPESLSTSGRNVNLKELRAGLSTAVLALFEEQLELDLVFNRTPAYAEMRNLWLELA